MTVKYRTKAGELIDAFLEDRFDRVTNGTLNPKEVKDQMGQRSAFYKTQVLFKQKYKLPDFDLAHKNPEQLHQAFLKQIRRYCWRKMKEIKTPENLPSTIDTDVLKYWGIMRSKGISIIAKEKALAYGYSGSFPVLEENRKKLRDEAFILLICEKEDVGRKILYELTQKNYVVNLVGTEGYPPCEVIETIFDIAELDDNFYIFVVHDMDINGYGIFYDIYRYFPKRTYSAGLNPEMLSHISTNITIWKEQYTPKEETIKSVRSFPITAQWLADRTIDLTKERIELIDDVVDPVVEYIEFLIQQNCKLWNLNRVTTPKAKDPAELKDLEYQTYLYRTIEEHSIGRYYDWTAIADLCKAEFIRQNKKYRRQITNYDMEIELESQVLQKLIDMDKKTQQNLKLIREKVKNVLHFLDTYYWEKVEFAEDFLYLFRFCFYKQP